jgi:hypothetical protein
MTVVNSLSRACRTILPQKPGYRAVRIFGSCTADTDSMLLLLWVVTVLVACFLLLVAQLPDILTLCMEHYYCEYEVAFNSSTCGWWKISPHLAGVWQSLWKTFFTISSKMQITICNIPRIEFGSYISHIIRYSEVFQAFVESLGCNALKYATTASIQILNYLPSIMFFTLHSLICIFCSWSSVIKWPKNHSSWLVWDCIFYWDALTCFVAAVFPVCVSPVMSVLEEGSWCLKNVTILQLHQPFWALPKVPVVNNVMEHCCTFYILLIFYVTYVLLQNIYTYVSFILCWLICLNNIIQAHF